MDPSEIKAAVTSGTPIPEEKIAEICNLAMQYLYQEGTVINVSTPVSICGDVHGQFFDVLKIFELTGTPQYTQYLFLGDYVDRGDFSVETIIILLAYKIMYPNRIFLLRGNHESRRINTNYGFYDDVLNKYGNLNVWQMINNVFDMLPYAAIVDQDIYCVHGGLSPQLTSIHRLALQDRNQEIPSEGILSDTVWSDPEEKIHNWGANSRGEGYIFGINAVEDFCQQNGVALIIRAHQVAIKGHVWHYIEGEHLTNFTAIDGLPSKVLTTWSAPNYCGMGNKATVTQISNQHDFTFVDFDHTPVDPSLLPDHNIPSYFQYG